MVISVFPDVSQGFQRYEQSRHNRLQAQAMRTEQEAMRRRQAAFNQMLGQIEDPQRRFALEAGGAEAAPQNLARFSQMDADAQAASVEAARAAQDRQLEFLTDAAERFPTWQQQNPEADPSGYWTRQATLAESMGIPIQRDESGAPTQFTNLGQSLAMGRAAPGADVPALQRTLGELVQRGRITQERADQILLSDVEVDAGIRPRPGSSAADALVGYLTSQIVPTTSASDSDDGRAAATALIRLGGSMRNIEDLADDIGPSGFAVAGAGRRVAQNIMQQFGSVSGLTLEGLRNEALGVARAAEEPDQDLIDAINRLYDPSLSTIGPAALALAYQAAETVANQSGRSLSDKDLAAFIRIVGDPTNIFTGYWDFKASIEALDREALNVINSERVVAGMPPVPRALSLRNGSAIEWISADPADRAAIVDSYSIDDGGTPPGSQTRTPTPTASGGVRTYEVGRGFRDE